MQPSPQNPASSCQIQNLRLWFKAFIPENTEGTELVPDGLHKGKTMLSSPGPVTAWFLTDGRGYSPSLEAQSRMHSEIEIDFVNFQVLHEFHYCDATIQVHHETGEELCRQTASTDDMSFEDIQIEPEAGSIAFQLKGSTKNACLKVAGVKISPNLDYELEIRLKLSANKQELEISIEGMVEVYPAFESYLKINDGAVVSVLQLPVEAGASPVSLMGPPQRPVNVLITTACHAG